MKYDVKSIKELSQYINEIDEGDRVVIRINRQEIRMRIETISPSNVVKPPSAFQVFRFALIGLIRKPYQAYGKP